MRTNVARCSAEYRGVLLPAVTLSAGVALYPMHGSAVDVIKAADTAVRRETRGTQPRQGFQSVTRSQGDN